MSVFLTSTADLSPLPLRQFSKVDLQLGLGLGGGPVGPPAGRAAAAEGAMTKVASSKKYQREIYLLRRLDNANSHLVAMANLNQSDCPIHQTDSRKFVSSSSSSSSSSSFFLAAPLLFFLPSPSGDVFGGDASSLLPLASLAAAGLIALRRLKPF